MTRQIRVTFLHCSWIWFYPNTLVNGYDFILRWYMVQHFINNRGECATFKNLYRLLILNGMHLIECKYNFCLRGQLPIQIWKKQIWNEFPIYLSFYLLMSYVPFFFFLVEETNQFRSFLLRCRVVVKSTDSETHLPGFESQPYNLWAMWLWASVLTSMYSNLHISKEAMIIAFPWKVFVESTWINRICFD